MRLERGVPLAEHAHQLAAGAHLELELPLPAGELRPALGQHHPRHVFMPSYIRPAFEPRHHASRHQRYDRKLSLPSSRDRAAVVAIQADALLLDCFAPWGARNDEAAINANRGGRFSRDVSSRRWSAPRRPPSALSAATSAAR